MYGSVPSALTEIPCRLHSPTTGWSILRIQVIPILIALVYLTAIYPSALARFKSDANPTGCCVLGKKPTVLLCVRDYH